MTEGLNILKPIKGICGDHLLWELTNEGILTIKPVTNINRKDLIVRDMNPLNEWRKHRDRVKKVIIEEGIEEVGSKTLWNCNNATDLIMPKSLKRITYMSFRSFASLTNIHFPEDLEYAGVEFFNTNWFKNLPMGDIYVGKIYFAHIGAVLANDKVVVKPGAKRIGERALKKQKFLTAIDIPEGVTVIGNAAFEGCISLKSIFLPRTINYISIYAFSHCDKLKRIALGNPIPPNVYTDTFYGIDISKITIYVPEESIGIYRDKAVWKDMKDILPLRRYKQ